MWIQNIEGLLEKYQAAPLPFSGITTLDDCLFHFIFLFQVDFAPVVVVESVFQECKTLVGY